METRPIGSLNVTIVGIGCNNFGRRIDEAGTRDVVHAALDEGINFFDTADIYGGTKSEEYLGKALGARRAEVVIATKFGNQVDEKRTGAKPDYVRQAVDDSLRRLRTDFIDLYQLHKPDPETPIADTLGALNDLVQVGKVREIGCSNFSLDQLREAEAVVQKGAARFVSVQNEYSLLQREAEAAVLPECGRAEIAFIPYSPLASGLLTGKYRLGQPAPEGTRLYSSRMAPELLTEHNLTLVAELIQFAESRGHSILELAFSWLASQSVITSIIAGATNAEQVKNNAAAINWKLTEADFEVINTILAK